MNFRIDTQDFEKRELLLSPSDNNNAWSYFNVYSLRDFRDVYNVIYKNEDVRSISSLLVCCKENGIQSESGKTWTERNLLELVNALKKTGLLDFKGMTPLVGNIFPTEYNSPLSKEDILYLRKIFYSYFRFKDFLLLFLDNKSEDKSENKGFVIAYMEDSRFFNYFVSFSNKTIYYLEGTKKNVMRFWDVFTKWGMTLKTLNKCSLNALNIDSCSFETQNGYLLNLAVPMPADFSVLSFLKEHFSLECIYIPDLEREIIFEYGYHIDDIKAAIIDECVKASNLYRMQRITEIFIERGERSLFPFVDGSYMSHILKLY